MNKKNIDIIFILALSFIMGIILSFIHPGKYGKKITLIKYSQKVDKETLDIINNIADSTNTTGDISDLPIIINLEEPKEIPLEACKNLFDSRTAIFIDARDSISYKEGHIESAYNIDWAADIDYQYEFLEDIPFSKILVVYCSGGDCDISRELGEELFYQGYKSLFLYEGGFPEWKSKNYPIDIDE